MHGPGSIPPEVIRSVAGSGRLEGPLPSRAVRRVINLATSLMGGEPPFKPEQPGMVIAERPTELERTFRGFQLDPDDPLACRITHIIRAGRSQNPADN